MKTNNIFIRTLFILNLLIASLYSTEQGVIVVSDNLDITNISKSDLEDIFLGRKTLWNNGKRIKIALSSQNAEKLNKFLVDNIGQNKRRFKKHWLKKVFSGYGIAPKIFNKNDKALAFAKKQDNSISYIIIENDTQLQGIKVIDIEGEKYFN